MRDALEPLRVRAAGTAPLPAGDTSIDAADEPTRL